MNCVTLKPKIGLLIGIFLDTEIEGKTAHVIGGSGVTAHDSLECQGNRCVTHRIFYSSGQGGRVIGTGTGSIVNHRIFQNKLAV